MGSSMGHAQLLHKMSWKLVLRNFANRQTNLDENTTSLAGA